ncbi:MAG: zinc ABC transporter ATP-binding protein ZnuC [Parvibaculaceae bacterium]|nr:zinc ABC transporter ATP-binding protein ZnuC [Kangiella sp.]
MTTQPLLELRSVSVRLGGREVVSHVGLAIGPAEIVTLIGPNGAGKTTLARTMLGILKPSAGTVVKRDGLRIGYVPQRISLEPTLPLTVRRLLTLTHRFDDAAMLKSLDEVGAAHLIDRQASELSGGEYQRVLLARALLGNPDLLILDEPTRGIDFAGQSALYDLLAHIRRDRGCAILLISHDLHVVMAASDRVICVNGHVCCEGAPEAVTNDPSYVALFGPGHAESLAVFKHHHDHVHDVSGDVLDDAHDHGPRGGGSHA